MDDHDRESQCPICAQLRAEHAANPTSDWSVRAFKHFQESRHLLWGGPPRDWRSLWFRPQRHEPTPPPPWLFFLLLHGIVLAAVLGLSVVACPPPLFLLPTLLLWFAGWQGAKTVSAESLGRKLFTRSQELALCLLPGILVWSVVFACVPDGDVVGWMKLADVESRLRQCERVIGWMKRIKAGEVAIAGVILLLYVTGWLGGARRWLFDATRRIMPWLRRATKLWIGLTAFTVLGPGPAAAKGAYSAKAALVSGREKLVAYGRRLADDALKTAIADAAEAAAEQPALAAPLDALDADAAQLSDCDRLKRQYDANGRARCPTPIDWEHQRAEAEAAIAAVPRTTTFQERYAERALDDLSLLEMHRRVVALEDDTPSEPPPSKELEYVAEKATGALYDAAAKDAVEAALGHASELELVKPIVDVLLQEPVKDAIARMVSRLVGTKGINVAQARAALHAAVKRAMPALDGSTVRALVLAANLRLRASASAGYVETLRRRQWAAERAAKEAKLARDGAEADVARLARELRESTLYVKIDDAAAGANDLKDEAADYVPRDHILAADAAAPAGATVIDAHGMSPAALDHTIRARAPHVYAMQARLVKRLRDADLLVVHPAQVIADPGADLEQLEKTTLDSMWGSPDATSWSAGGGFGPRPHGTKLGLPTEDGRPTDPTEIRDLPPELPRFEPRFEPPRFEPHFEVPHFVL